MSKEKTAAIAAAAAIMGRKGGRSKSPAKLAACRKNCKCPKTKKP